MFKADEHGRLWQVRVYAGPGALGNLTGVVTVRPDTTEREMARWASLLGHPDTAFVRSTARGLEVLSFSPYEQVRLCTQTLLATQYVTGPHRDPAGTTTVFLTAAGPVTVTRPRDGFAYVELPTARTTVRRANTPPPGAGGLSDGVVVDTGRARAYFTVTLEDLEAARLSPDEVRRYCEAEQVTGVCLAAPAGPQFLRFRVYTTSLDGAEDTATGGAAGGLCALHDALGRPLTGDIRVEQGTGGPQTRALLHVRPAPTGGALVGGAVTPVSTGRLHTEPC